MAPNKISHELRYFNINEDNEEERAGQTTSEFQRELLAYSPDRDAAEKLNSVNCPDEETGVVNFAHIPALRFLRGSEGRTFPAQLAQVPCPGV